MIEERPLKNPSQEWLLRAAEFEETCLSTSAGGLAVDLGLYTADGKGQARIVFGQCINIMRTAQGWSVERLAEAVGVAPSEIAAIESHVAAALRTETVLRLAEVLQVRGERLLELALLAPRLLQPKTADAAEPGRY